MRHDLSPFRWHLCLLILALVGFHSEANAQVIGSRPGPRFGNQTGQSRPGTAPADAPNDVGQVSGAERFLRGNRDRASFVGADRTETQSFVGSEQATMAGTIVSSTAGITPTPDMSRSINQPLKMPTATEMYLPRISISSLPAMKVKDRPKHSQVSRSMNDPVVMRVERAVKLVSGSTISVSVQERTAILRGAVASESEKRLAETLALFEPGISEVTNQLTVSATIAPL